VAVPATDVGTLAPIVLGFGAEAEALEPPALRDEVRRRLAQIVDA
jgi:predicted DNA-binding transcriptional regulator YafY